MKKKVLLVIVLIQLLACGELQQIVNQLPQVGMGVTNLEIGQGLREALNIGIDKQVSKLTATDGFYNNALVKILLPEELRKVDKTLRDIGLGKMADEGLRILNRAAETAVGEATPIFIDAVKEITFVGAKNILLGNDDAATRYLSNKTQTALYAKFNPIIRSSFEKVRADAIWNNLITRYNSIPLVKKVNPNLTDYVTNEALKGVYTMISIEEKEIRNKVSSRTSDLLRKVFTLQD